MTTYHAPLSSAASSPAPVTVQDKLRLLSGGNSWSADDLRKLANDLAQSLEFAKEVGGLSDADLIKQAQDWVGVGGDLSVQGKTTGEQVARLLTSKFWRRTLRRKVWRAVEADYLKKGAIGGQTDKRYVSDFSSEIKRQMDEQQQEWLAASRVEATIDGELVSLQLADLHDKNEKSRLAEFLAWSAGFQKLADKQGLEIAMLTLTLPGEFHPNPIKGKKNWNGIAPDVANKEIGQRWSQVRSSLRQQGITLSGFRSAEPAQDGTPHWHLCIAYRPGERGLIMSELLKLFPLKLKLKIGKKGVKKYFDTPDDALAGRWRPAKKTEKKKNADDEENEGAQVDLTVVDTSAGAKSLTNYVIKYVTKWGMKRTQPLIKN